MGFAGASPYHANSGRARLPPSRNPPPFDALSAATKNGSTIHIFSGINHNGASEVSSRQCLAADALNIKEVP